MILTDFIFPVSYTFANRKGVPAPVLIYCSKLSRKLCHPLVYKSLKIFFTNGKKLVLRQVFYQRRLPAGLLDESLQLGCRRTVRIQDDRLDFRTVDYMEMVVFHMVTLADYPLQVHRNRYFLFGVKLAGLVVMNHH